MSRLETSETRRSCSAAARTCSLRRRRGKIGLQMTSAVVNDEPTRVEMWVLAQPLRLRLFELLRRSPATASQLARKLGVTSGTTSYHLRILERAGAIESDATLGNRRERWWRRRELVVIPTDADREGRAIAERMLSIYLARDEEARHRFVTTDVADEWHEGAVLGNWFLELTPAEAGELGLRLMQLVDELRMREPSADAERALVSISVLPWLA